MEEKIGSGAFGEVFRGKWRGVDVAVKKTLVAEGQAEEFFSEVAVMQKLRPHTNITQLFGVCIEPLCIVTEFIVNGSLINWLQHHTVDNTTKVNIARGIAAGMMHLHGEGIIHRDLAARNILLDKVLCPKVADFGMSRNGSTENINQTRNTVGPIRWMAPEALSERMYNTKTDVWSFGVTLYEIMTHKMPYEKLDLTQTCGAVIMGTTSLYQDLEARQAEYPSVLVSLMKLCMEREPNARPEFKQIVDMLDQ